MKNLYPPTTNFEIMNLSSQILIAVAVVTVLVDVVTATCTAGISAELIANKFTIVVKELRIKILPNSFNINVVIININCLTFVL